MYFFKRIASIFYFFFCTQSTFAQVPEAKVLDTIFVKEKANITTIGKSIPVQMLNKNQLKNSNSFQLSDALKTFSGVLIKDYGGIGGLKTISVRSLGAQHSAVSYDDVLLNDSQAGTIDLGKIPTENIEFLSLSNGLPNKIDAPARNFSAANVLSVNSLFPNLEDNKIYSVNAGLQIGSFGLWSPSLYYAQKINSKITSSTYFNYQYADGKYSFLEQNGVATRERKRSNTDVKSLLVENNLFWNLSKTQTLQSKIYYYKSDRGLPGAVVLYNDNESRQRNEDGLFFTQLKYQQQFSKIWTQNIHFKYQQSSTDYHDPDWIGQKLENLYRQKEWYLSFVNSFKISNQLHTSFAFDYANNQLKANASYFAAPTRQSYFANMVLKYKSNLLDATFNLLNNIVTEKVEKGKAMQNVNRTNPSFFLTLKPFQRDNFLLRAFVKNSFRLPNFNDLYYTLVGVRTLKPEEVTQFNIGATFNTSVARHIDLSIAVDAYKNYVNNKIVAYPSYNMFSWTMLNVDKVEITGADVCTKLNFVLPKNWFIHTDVNYTFQQSLNVSNPKDANYLHQIAYTPLHSLSGGFSVEKKQYTFSYRMLWSGWRYSSNENNNSTYLDAYGDHSVSLRKEFKLWNTSYQMMAEVLNLYNTQYEIVRSYPMPGRSFRLKMNINF
ncbi:MAG: TonB-dependent receptor plug domain-containing protein [Sphingobacteriaceae bacterium]|nr:TonB-dependent receptor plug domain-containing protein [Sphingobacteriaceae bacterium]